MKVDRSLYHRRDVLNGLMGAGVVGIGAVGGKAALDFLTGVTVPEPESITVSGQALEVLAEQRYVLVPYGPHPVMIFRLPDDEVRVLSAVCTHGQCNVHYRPEENDIYCGCHHGRFTVDGENVPGTPPPRPLRRFHVNRQEDGTLLVSAEPPETAEPSGSEATG